MARARQIADTTATLFSGRGRKALLGWKPFSLTAFKMLNALASHGLLPRTIVDGGANVGQFARAAAETFPEARIIAFEPLPDVADKLRTNLSDCQRAEVRAVALGSVDGAVSFRRNRYSPASSILRLRADATESFPQVREDEELEVPVVRLDTILDHEVLEPPVLLKLDLQGYELEALRGAEATLRRTQHVLLETSFRAIYEEEPSFEEIHALMRSSGFRFACPIDVLRDTQGRITQMDALFERV
jgi:FkbM family methyltransferase